ncbi:12094_t:CDS:10 [Acaulospora morrowiae]|uniref:12094_t:CDS:1 n=1 Tax=Acaulospora morrowiae TaxID=94023 RepID=A0A9N8ZV59_9GLOM|nr:12094_t:CDS:10 [Acaulospora morrowiae]
MESLDVTENKNDLEGIPLEEFDFEKFADETEGNNDKLEDTSENDLYLDDDYKEHDLAIEGFTGDVTSENTTGKLVLTQEDVISENYYLKDKEMGHVPEERNSEDISGKNQANCDPLKDNNISRNDISKDLELSKENDNNIMDKTKENDISRKDDQKMESKQDDVLEYYDEENEQGLDYLEGNHEDILGLQENVQVVLTQEDMLSDDDILDTNDNEPEISDRGVVGMTSDMPVKKTYSRKEKNERDMDVEENDSVFEELDYSDYNKNEIGSRNESGIHTEAEEDVNSNVNEDGQNPIEKMNKNRFDLNDKEAGVVGKNKSNVVLSQEDMLEDEFLEGMLDDEEFLNNIDKNGDKPDDGFSDDNFDNETAGNEKQHVDLSSQDMLEETKIPEPDNYIREAEKKKFRPYDDFTKPQATFQPGSTPMKNHRQYLAMNSVGSISTMEHETFSTITVEYHDQSHNRGYNLRDDFNYSMACLDANGALFATESVKVNAVDTNPSILFYKPRETWAAKGEWMLTLPHDEDIIAIALGSEGIIASTSKGVLRFFSLCGVQTYIFNLSSVVSMVARNEFALIVYNMGIGYKGSQSIGYILYDFRSREILQRDRMPISKDSILQWIGFSEEGMPAMFDSKGVLSVLHHYRTNNQGRWIPILDTSLNRKEEEKEWVYWPVWLNENKLICFICKNGEQYPSIPRPSFDEVNLQIPLLNLDKKDGQYEEKVMRMSVITRFEFDEAKARNSLEWEREKIKQKNKEINDTLLELIMLSCQEEKLQRALDLAKMLSTTKSLDKAIKIANFKKLPILAEKINQIKSVSFSPLITLLSIIFYMDTGKLLTLPYPASEQNNRDAQSTDDDIAFSISNTKSNFKSHKPLDDILFLSSRIAHSPPLNTSSYRQNLSNALDTSGGYDSLTFGSEGDNELMISTSSTSSSYDTQTGSKRRVQEIEHDDLYYDESPKVKKTNQVGTKKNPFLQKPNNPIINPFAVSNESNADEEPETKKAKTIKENKKVAQKRQAKLGEHFGGVTKETSDGQDKEQETESINSMAELGPGTYNTEVNEERREDDITAGEKQSEVIVEEETDTAVLETNVIDKDIEEFNEFEGDPTESQYLMDFDLEQNPMDLEQIPADYEQDPSAVPEEA